MLNYIQIFADHVHQIKKEGRYRDFSNLKRLADKFPYALDVSTGKEIVMWCINDYLGMSKHPDVINAGVQSLIKYGIGSGGTRNIGGNNDSIVRLEKELASLHEKQSALLFTSGYVANDATLSILPKIFPNIVFFSDESNHASIISGIRNSRAQKYIYKHLDMQDLEKSLQSVDINIPKIIVFESVYSMDGYISPIKKICDLAEQYNALTFIDEVHTVGLYGNQGAGIANALGCNVDIIEGTLAKAYGTIGGYITGNSSIIDAIRLTSSGFIFTTSLPPVITESALASINYLKNSNTERLVHQLVVKKVKQSFNSANINYLKNESHIIPIIIGDPNKAREASRMLLDKYQIYVQHINFPTVPRGSERLRITPTPEHNDAMIENLTLALVEVFNTLDIKYFSQVA